MYQLYQTTVTDEIFNGHYRRINKEIPCPYSQEELSKMMNYAIKIEELFHYAGRITSVDKALAQLINSDRDNVEDNFETYIDKFDVFIKHWEKTLTDFGMRQVFVKTTHDAYDQSDGYKLACILRNIKTHQSELIDHIHEDFNGIEISMKKQRILDNRKFSKSKKEFVKGLPDSIDLAQVAMQSHQAATELSLEFTFCLFQDFKKYFEYLNNQRVKLENTKVVINDNILICTIPEPETNTALAHYQLPKGGFVSDFENLQFNRYQVFLDVWNNTQDKIKQLYNN